MIWLKKRLKGWRTIVANILFGVVPVLELTEWQAVLPEGWVPWYALFIALANMALRSVTTTPIGRNE